jgi:predicted heme/steroid binding protein
LYELLKVAFLAEEPRRFTLKELEEYNGKGGKPAYVAYKGKVYDVSEVPLWLDGDHLGTHQAGKDLTADMEMAPHRNDVLERVKLIGVLV